MFDWFFHPPAKAKPFRPLFQGAAIFALINLVSALTVRLLGSDSLLSFNIGMAATGTALFARFAAHRMVDWEESIELVRKAHFEEEPVLPGVKFCTDCGRTFVLRQRQNGFDPVTGKAKLFYQMGCPDGDPNRETAAYTRWRTRSSGLFNPDPPRRQYDWPECGKTKNAPLAPVGHLHADAETHTDCPKCIETMHIDGVISIHDARKLIEAIGHVEA